MKQCLQRALAEWLQTPVEIKAVTPVREWSESKVVRVTAIVDGEEQTYYGKLARSNFDTELAVCRLASQTPSFPAPPGTSMEIEGETWLLLRDASGKLLARNQSPKAYEQASQSLAHFHEQELANQLAGLEQLAEQVEHLAGFILAEVEAASSQGVFTEVDLSLLNQVKDFISTRWQIIKSLLTSYPMTLVHGDCHSGNLFLDDDGKLSLIDWGSAMVGPGLFDIVGLVDVALRMRDPIGDVDHLLRLYWDSLSDKSRDAYGDLDEAWQVLRVCRSLLELGWFTRTEDDYGTRANRELQIMWEALSYLA